MGQALVDALNCAYEGRGATAGPLLPGTLREGVVVLLHKGGALSPADPASYRPITLFNCDQAWVMLVMERMGFTAPSRRWAAMMIGLP